MDYIYICIYIYISSHSKLDSWILLQILIDTDMKDQLSGRIHEIHQLLPSAYGNNPISPNPLGLIHPTLGRLPLPGIKPLIGWLSSLFFFQEMNQAHKLLILIWILKKPTCSKSSSFFCT